MLTTSSARAARIALTTVLVFPAVVFQLSAACNDYDCYGVNVCSSEGECVEPTDCRYTSNIQDKELNIQIRGPKCRVTLEAIRQALPEYVTKDGEEYTLKKKLIVRDGCVLEIHGASAASSSDAAVSVLKLKSDESGYAPIIADHGKISIIDTAVISYDESLDGPDERLEDRAYIAALSSESDDQTKVWESRMDVHNSEISYLGIEGDYHNDVEETFGLLWKVMGYDDRYPGDLELFDRVGVYGSLTDSKIHHNYIGAYCYGMKGSSVWSGNEIYSNSLVGINPQDNSDDMTLTGNHVHDNGWHGIEYSKRCQGALVYDNIVEDNGRAGIFFHRSTDYADAYNNTAKRNAEGDFGIYECTGVTIHDNIMEGGKYGIRISMGAQECDVYNNVMSDSTRYGVFFYRGSDEAEASADWDGRPRYNIIRDNYISDPDEGKGVAVTDSDYNEILDNVFVGIDSLRFDGSTETLVLGNVLPDGVSFDLEDGANLAEGSQDPTD